MKSKAPTIRSKRPTVLSVFTGCGGMDLGFEAAGFQCVAAVEKEPWACATLRRNHPGLIVIGPPEHEGRVEHLSGKSLLTLAGLRKGDVDVVIGGPPCQPFSQAASQRFLKTDPRFKRRGFEDELRGTLLAHFIRIIEELRPRVFVLENVAGMMNMDDGVQLNLALEELGKEGFRFSEPSVLEAAEFGVPQFRRRMIVWGSRTIDDLKLPSATHGTFGDLFTGADIEPFRIAAQALLGITSALPNHITREHKVLSQERYQKLQFGQRDKLGRADRLDPSRPSKTVIAGGLSGGGRSHLHPFLARTLSVRECARLQTFPDDFIFEGSTARQFTQVGNAVPPLLAEQLGRHILRKEFGRENRAPLTHAQQFDDTTPKEKLVKRLLDEARQENGEQLYMSHRTKRVKRTA